MSWLRDRLVEVVLAAARMRFLARLRKAQIALLGLLQVAGADWRHEVVQDLKDTRAVLAPRLDQLPLPSVETNQWLDLASQHPAQWNQLIKCIPKEESTTTC